MKSGYKEIGFGKLTIGKVFEEWYTVPSYQRHYVWDTDNVNDMLEDFSANYLEHDNEEYFLGSYIIQSKDKNNDLLDGQQRITTLFLLFAFLRDYEKSSLDVKENCINLIFQKANRIRNIEERVRLSYEIRGNVKKFIEEYDLRERLKSGLYEKQQSATNNFIQTMPVVSARKAIGMFKDEYLLDFINVEEIEVDRAADVDERVVEQAIVRNVKQFIMTFGRDFAYIGNQYHLEIFTNEMFPDLLFFNRELNCMVCVELKTGAFKPGYIGQLHTYMRVLDDKVRKPHENPTIGILLCKSADKAFVEYVISDYNSPMGVATYKTADDMDERMRKSLPDMEEMRKLLSEDTGVITSDSHK